MVTTAAPIGLSNSSFFAAPSRLSGTYFFPVNTGSTKHMTNWIITDQLAKYIPSCTQPCGAPRFCVICKARMRVAMNKMQSIGANCTVDRVPHRVHHVAHDVWRKVFDRVENPEHGVDQ